MKRAERVIKRDTGSKELGEGHERREHGKKLCRVDQGQQHRMELGGFYKVGDTGHCEVKENRE